MTEAYMMHQTEELKRNAIEKYSMASLSPDSGNVIKELAIKLIRECQEPELVLKIVQNLKG